MYRMAFLHRAALTLALTALVLGAPTAASASNEPKSLAKQLGLAECSEEEYLEDFALPDINGNMVSRADLSGQVLLLNFWATWCHSCKKERKALQAVSEAFDGQGLKVVAICADPKGKDRVPKYIEEHKLTFLHLLDDDRVLVKRFKVHVLPTSFIVGRDGRLLSKGIGDIAWDSEIGNMYFNQLLNEGGPTGRVYNPR